MSMFQANQMYPTYPQAYPQPYQDRLAQLQSQYQQALPQSNPQAFPAGQGVLWVQGDAGAKAYMVAPNTTVLLMDSEAPRFYLKSTDVSGVPTLRTFEYSEIANSQNPILQKASEEPENKFVTRAEYSEMQNKFKELMEKMDSLQIAKTTEKQGTSKSKGVSADEQSNI